MRLQITEFLNSLKRAVVQRQSPRNPKRCDGSMFSRLVNMRLKKRTQESEHPEFWSGLSSLYLRQRLVAQAAMNHWFILGVGTGHKFNLLSYDPYERVASLLTEGADLSNAECLWNRQVDEASYVDDLNEYWRDIRRPEERASKSRKKQRHVLASLSRQLYSPGTTQNQTSRAEEDILLWKLATDDKADIRLSVAVNPFVDGQLLSVLATDKEEQIRKSVALNDKCPLNVLHELKRDRSKEVAGAAAVTLSRVTVLAKTEFQPNNPAAALSAAAPPILESVCSFVFLRLVVYAAGWLNILTQLANQADSFMAVVAVPKSRMLLSGISGPGQQNVSCPKKSAFVRIR